MSRFAAVVADLEQILRVVELEPAPSVSMQLLGESGTGARIDQLNHGKADGWSQ
jgi:hypothetical protein